jgi:hypothetical protein
MKAIILFLSFLMPLAAFAQTNSVAGDVLDEKGGGLGYATVALMNPADSTLAFFGITNVGGHYEIRNTKPGDYLMQVAYLGYQTQYRRVKLPLESGNDYGAIVMKPTPLNLSELQVKGEYIPLLLKKDTIEYNAAAFKTKPDAVVEDLLRKLPGIDVDRAGNIKAVGEDVRNVLVDGKEFFGNDPKVATRNVPADAVKKVQVYDKKSDESEFTGVSDGSHDKMVNLMLKDDKKKAIFGDVMAGGGTGDHYQGSAKIYRFTGANQFAALGMINNINQFGFSFSDYLNFSGGLGAFSGGTVRLGMTADNSYPVNFGQPVNGYVTSGAAGLNYLGNATGTRLDQHIYSENFIPGGSFVQDKASSTNDENWAHRVNFGWKNRIDSTQNLVFSGGASLTTNSGSGSPFTESYRNDSLINSLKSLNSNRDERLSGNFSGSYIKKMNAGRSNLKLSGNASYSYGLGKIQWQNTTHFYDPDLITDLRQYQKNMTDRLQGEVSLSLTQKTGKVLYLEPTFTAGYTGENLERKQGVSAETGEIIDSLSPAFSSQYLSLQPALRLKWNTEKTSFAIAAHMELGRMQSRLKNEPDRHSGICAFTPQISWEYEYNTGKRLAFAYESSVNTPTANQLMPIPDNINPLILSYGNQSLKPEYRHEAYFNWWLFDQFSFTSLFTTARFTYTRDKINWARTINNSLEQTITLINVPDDYSASLSIDFSTPIRKLGLDFHTSIRENWDRGFIYVNNAENTSTSLAQRLTVSFSNRKKEKWDLNFGVSFSLTDARYSLQKSLNNRYFDLAYFGDLRFTPNDRWSFAASADVTNYNARTFHNMVNVPLIGAEVTFYFLKNNRGLLTLAGYDLLNKNTGVERVSEMNYLRETRSNIIGRYVMLSFKYRLNKFKEQSGIDIKLDNRRR